MAYFGLFWAILGVFRLFGHLGIWGVLFGSLEALISAQNGDISAQNRGISAQIDPISAGQLHDKTAKSGIFLSFLDR